jgi:putative chitinase
MKIDIQTLVACGVGPTQARLFADPLAAACQRFGIDTPQRFSAFMAQALHESCKFTRLEENLFYSTPERILQVFRGRVHSLDDALSLVRNPKALANRVYSGRLGNGSEASGDGWANRGRGIFQLTGRDNYQRAADAIGVDYVAAPDLVAQPEHACLTAAHFWVSNGCNDAADAGDVRAITAKVNGPALLGLTERTTLYMDVLEAVA